MDDIFNRLITLRILPKAMRAPSWTAFSAAGVTQYVQFVYCSRSRLQFRFLIYLLAHARLDSGTAPHAHQKTDRALWHGRARFSGQPDRTRSHGEARRFRAIAGYGKVARIGAAGMREGGRGERQDYFAQRSGIPAAAEGNLRPTSDPLRKRKC